MNWAIQVNTTTAVMTHSPVESCRVSAVSQHLNVIQVLCTVHTDRLVAFLCRPTKNFVGQQKCSQQSADIKATGNSWSPNTFRMLAIAKFPTGIVRNFIHF